MQDYAKSESSMIAQKLTDAKKREVLDGMSEEDFRDKVVRPIYRRRGLTHLRDTHGTDELGSDCIFVGKDPLGSPMVIAIQTKKGPVTMAGTTPSNALTVIETQLDMALKTPILLGDNATKLKPAQSHLCTTGKISNSARTHLENKLEAHRIKLFGSDELVEIIDAVYPEFWLGVDADRFPYARELRRRLCTAEDVIKVLALSGEPGTDSPVIDENYLRLRLTHMGQKTVTKVKQHKVKHRSFQTTETQIEPKFMDISVEDLPKQHHRLSLITGEGGAGKTTAIRRLAVTLIDEVLSGSDTALLPVVLKARQIAAFPRTLTELIVEETTAIAGGKCPVSTNYLEGGGIALLIDALEEVDDGARDRVLGQIIEFHKSYPECLIALTSRDYRSILELTQIARFVHYWILPLALKEADGLITRVIDKKHVDKSMVRSTLKKLNEAHGLNLSPMLISVFLASSDFTKQDLPPNIAEIFKKFTEQMIGRWDTTKGIHQQFEANTKDFLLRQLAFHMHNNKVRSIEESDVRRMFECELQKRDLDIDTDRVFDEVVHRSGLLRTDGKVVEWRHHLLQEYFAGRGVPNAQFFTTVVSDEWWRTPMVFYFGDKPESFAELWAIVEKAGLLNLAALFDAAISIGLSVQACYLAEMQQKVKTIAWVIESFAKSMQEFRGSINEREGGGKATMALCAVVALGRDAIATRTLARLPDDLSTLIDQKDALFKPVDPSRIEAWRIIGLLEAGEIDLAITGIKKFRTDDRDLIFMVYLSVAWAVHYHDVKGEAKKFLDQHLRDRVEVIDDMRQALFKEFKTMLLQMRGGKLLPAADAEVEARTPD